MKIDRPKIIIGSLIGLIGAVAFNSYDEKPTPEQTIKVDGAVWTVSMMKQGMEKAQRTKDALDAKDLEQEQEKHALNIKYDVADSIASYCKKSGGCEQLDNLNGYAQRALAATLKKGVPEALKDVEITVEEGDLQRSCQLIEKGKPDILMLETTLDIKFHPKDAYWDVDVDTSDRLLYAQALISGPGICEKGLPTKPASFTFTRVRSIGDDKRYLSGMIVDDMPDGYTVRAKAQPPELR